MKRNYGIILVYVLMACLFVGCGKKGNIISNGVKTQIDEQNTKPSDATECNAQAVTNDDANTMYINGESDYLNDYDTVDALMEDACAIIKIKVLQSNSANVRSYIYTSYQTELLDVIYGEAGKIGDILNINMPGGRIEGEAAQQMLSEITEGKNVGDLSEINKIVSDAGTDRLLQNGDEAYLFIRKESGESYAAVGEYRGEFLLNSGRVLFDEKIKGFTEGTEIFYSGDSISEEDFVSEINVMQ